MPVPPVTLGGVYSAIVKIQNLANPQVQWRNSWDFISPAAPTPGTNIIAAILDFQQQCIHSDAQIVDISAYHWARGRQPYPQGMAIFTEPVQLVGTADAGWGFSSGEYVPLGGEVVARIDHTPNVGNKPGRTFLRGLIGKNEVSALSGGRYSMVSGSPVTNTKLQQVLTNSTLAGYIGTQTAGQQLCIVRYSRKTGTVTGNVSVSGFVLMGVSTNRQTRKNPR